MSDNLASTRLFTRQDMRNEDLMVGDWFRFRYTIDGKEIVKTFRIRRTADDIGYVWGEGFGRMCIPERLEPIPLTAEILEKNFGEKIDEMFFDGDEFYELFIHEINDGTWIIKHDNIEFSNIPRQQVMVGYVHELQHALRLCGIEKEVVL